MAREHSISVWNLEGVSTPSVVVILVGLRASVGLFKGHCSARIRSQISNWVFVLLLLSLSLTLSAYLLLLTKPDLSSPPP